MLPVYEVRQSGHIITNDTGVVYDEDLCGYLHKLRVKRICEGSYVMYVGRTSRGEYLFVDQSRGEWNVCVGNVGIV